MAEEKSMRQRIIVVPGQPWDSDSVYYDSKEGLLVAKMPQNPPIRVSLFLLAPRLTLETDDKGIPVYLELQGSREYLWGRRKTIEPKVTEGRGRVVVSGPPDHDYWFGDRPTVACDEAGHSVMIELDRSRTAHRAIRISPRVSVLLDSSDGLVSIYLKEVEIR